MIAVDESILNKVGKLSYDEWKEIKSHADIGYRMLNTVNEMSDIAICVLYHHERYDGYGYPKGLKGKDIPISSRVLCIVDAYNTMTTEGNYKSILSKELAIKELQNNAGTQFDPELLTVFIEKVLKTPNV